MRVISGEYGGRPLKAVPGNKTRPTTDKIKEAVFHILGPYFDGGSVLDLYSGSGSLGIEAVSRGMDEAVLVDMNYKAIKVINENIEITKEPEKFIVLKKKDHQAILELKEQNKTFNLVLLDPPYATQEITSIIENLNKQSLLRSNAMIMCETDKLVELPSHLSDLEMIKEKLYGTTKITVYQKGGIQ